MNIQLIALFKQFLPKLKELHASNKAYCFDLSTGVFRELQTKNEILINDCFAFYFDSNLDLKTYILEHLCYFGHTYKDVQNMF